MFYSTFYLPIFSIINLNSFNMSEQKKQYESVLCGWADEPNFNDNGELMSWTFRLKDNELKDVLDQYLTRRDEEGRGGNARFKLFMSKNGKPCLSIWDPNSAAAQERQNSQAKDGAAKADDLPF